MEQVDKDLLLEILANFETGKDLDELNPFDVENGEITAEIVEPYLTGGVVPETELGLRSFLKGEATLQDAIHAGALAGMLQGLAIGYDYARRRDA